MDKHRRISAEAIMPHQESFFFKDNSLNCSTTRFIVLLPLNQKGMPMPLRAFLVLFWEAPLTLLLLAVAWAFLDAVRNHYHRIQKGNMSLR